MTSRTVWIMFSSIICVLTFFATKYLEAQVLPPKYERTKSGKTLVLTAYYGQGVEVLVLDSSEMEPKQLNWTYLKGANCVCGSVQLKDTERFALLVECKSTTDNVSQIALSKVNPVIHREDNGNFSTEAIVDWKSLGLALFGKSGVLAESREKISTSGFTFKGTMIHRLIWEARVAEEGLTEGEKRESQNRILDRE